MTAQAECLDAPRIPNVEVEQGDGHRLLRTALRTALPPLGIVAAVLAISLLHYGTCVHSTLLHEIFKRLYYVPIVMAAVTFGPRGGLATSMLVSLLFLPHIVIDWDGWPVFAAERYGELVLFNVVALLTGVLSGRLRAERNRYRDAAAELQRAYCHLEARTDERLRIDRLVTVGRIASGIAHEIRNPLGSLLGCIEILESDFPRAHPKREFFAIARKEMRRLDSVVSAFLEFAEPAPPSSRAVNLNDVVLGAARLARPSLAERGVTFDLQTSRAAAFVTADAEQIQRALLNVMLWGTSELRDSRVALKVLDTGRPAVVLDFHGAGATFTGADVFDPFPPSGRGHGLALATARRLVENQQGVLRAERRDAGLRFVMELRAARPPRTTEVALAAGGDG
jgi:signal transduction histidine kinase